MTKVGLFIGEQKIKAELKEQLEQHYLLVELNENDWLKKAASLPLALVEGELKIWPKKLKEAGCAYILGVAREAALNKINFQYVDDFIVYPLRIAELNARLKRPLTNSTQSHIIQIEDLIVDTDKYEVLIAGSPLELTYKEYELLKFLVEHPERVWSRQALLNRIWEYDYFGGTRTVDVHIRRLRAKLGPKYSQYLQTVRHVGYKWGVKSFFAGLF